EKRFMADAGGMTLGLMRVSLVRSDRSAGYVAFGAPATYSGTPRSSTEIPHRADGADRRDGTGGSQRHSRALGGWSDQDEARFCHMISTSHPGDWSITAHCNEQCRTLRPSVGIRICSPQPKSIFNRLAHGSFASQSQTERSALDTIPRCKSALIALPFNCRSQQ